MKNQLKYKGIPISSYMLKGIEINFKEADSFGIDSGVGIHLMQPSHNELMRSIEDAKIKGHSKVYVYGFIRNEYAGLES